MFCVFKERCSGTATSRVGLGVDGREPELWHYVCTDHADRMTVSQGTLQQHGLAIVERSLE
jgi:hypothetical protein